MKVILREFHYSKENCEHYEVLALL